MQGQCYSDWNPSSDSAVSPAATFDTTFPFQPDSRVEAVPVPTSVTTKLHPEHWGIHVLLQNQSARKAARETGYHYYYYELLSSLFNLKKNLGLSGCMANHTIVFYYLILFNMKRQRKNGKECVNLRCLAKGSNFVLNVCTNFLQHVSVGDPFTSVG